MHPTTATFRIILLGFVAAAHAATVTITTAPTLPTAEPEWVDGGIFTSAILNSTNVYRSQHNASAVKWNATLESFAARYLDDNADCKFAHSGGPYGENLALGFPNATASVEAWGDERRLYDFRRPDFSEATGHFTQLVWKATTDVGCGRKLCRTGWYLVCEYWPRGNVIGQFGNEVGGQRGENAAAPLRPIWSLVAGLLSAGVVLAW